MKRCPKCNRQYADDTLRFCLEDGSPLTATTRDAGAPPTEILPSVPLTQKSTAPTIASYPGADYARAQPTESRQSNPLLTAGVIAIALLLLILVGVAAYYAIKQSGTGESVQVNPAAGPIAKPAATPAKSDTRDEGDESVATPAENSAPLKITASASSMRLAVQANTYYASNTIDGKRTTAWIEGTDGPGIGEWIRYDFDREINLHRILIQPGYFKSASIWSQNNRLARVTAQFSDGSSRQLNFDDAMQGQKTDVGSIKTRWVRLVIESVYYGSDPDTAVSEVAFEWEP